MPLRFEANLGPSDSGIHFTARNAGGAVWLRAGAHKSRGRGFVVVKVQDVLLPLLAVDRPVVSGFLQIVARGPAGLAGTVPVVLKVGGIPSRQNVTVAVRPSEPVE
jgi:hypothetical protein